MKMYLWEICGIVNTLGSGGTKMYFQFMIEDHSTEILVDHVMEKFRLKYPEQEIIYDSKSFSGIGHLKTSGNLFERKGSKLDRKSTRLNSSHM